MKAKLFRGATFIVLVIVLFLLLNYRYVHSAYYRSIEGIFLYENIPDDLQIVNFGSSHAKYGIDYSLLPELRCFNFAFASQIPYIDNLLLQTYKRKLGDDCVVIIPISYFSLYRDVFTAQIPRYYRVLKGNRIPNVEIDGLIKYKYLPVLSSKKNVIEVFSHRIPPSYSTPDGTTDVYKLNDLGKERAQDIINETVKQNLVVENVDGLTDMLQSCRENGWKPVVITTPLTEYYKKWYSNEFIGKFHSDLDEILSEYPEAIYRDYSSDGRFYEHPEYFVDTDHLNHAGQKLFTEILFNDCKDLGLL